MTDDLFLSSSLSLWQVFKCFIVSSAAGVTSLDHCSHCCKSNSTHSNNLNSSRRRTSHTVNCKSFMPVCFVRYHSILSEKKMLWQWKGSQIICRRGPETDWLRKTGGNWRQKKQKVAARMGLTVLFETSCIMSVYECVSERYFVFIVHSRTADFFYFNLLCCQLFSIIKIKNVVLLHIIFCHQNIHCLFVLICTGLKYCFHLHYML
jgi:hypothetical protein